MLLNTLNNATEGFGLSKRPNMRKSDFKLGMLRKQLGLDGLLGLGDKSRDQEKSKEYYE